jgi:branched-chain amino acid transport system substrate-binding protein
MLRPQARKRRWSEETVLAVEFEIPDQQREAGSGSLPTPRRVVAIALTALTAAFGVVGCGGKSSTNATKGKPIVIGSISILTGPVSGIGIDTLRGARAELGLLNRQGGINGSKLQLVSTDDANDPSKAVADASRLIQSDHVAGIIGPINSVSGIAIQKLLTGPGTPAVAYQSGAEELTAPCIPDQFRTAASLRQLFDGLALYEIKKLGHKRMAFIGWDLAAGKSALDGTSDAAKQTGVPLAYSTRLPITTQDFSGQIAQAKAKNPDLVLIGAPMPFAGVVAKQIRESGWNVTIAASGDFVSTDFGGFLGKAADQIFMSDNAHWKGSEAQPDGKAFIDYFMSHYGRPPNANELVGADALHTMAMGIKDAGSTSGGRIADALHSNTIPGLRFPIAYNKCGDISNPSVVGVIWRKQGTTLDLVTPNIFNAVRVALPPIHH